MANTQPPYDPGPQLPNYMKKRMAAQAKQTEALASEKTKVSTNKNKYGASGGAKAPAEEKPARRSAAPAAPARAPKAQRVESPRKAATPAAPSRQRSASSTDAQSKKIRSSGSAKCSSGGRAKSSKKKKDYSALLKGLVVATAALAIILFGVWFFSSSGETGAANIGELIKRGRTFDDGVKLIGVDVSGLTAEEATGLVKNAAENRLKSVAVTVTAAGSSWTLDYKALGMDYDITAALEAGMEYDADKTGVHDVTGAGAGQFDAEYTWSRAAIEAALAAMAAEINTLPTAPYAEPVTNWASADRFNYLAGEEGRELNLSDTADRIEAALANGEFTVGVDALVNAVLPEGNIDDLKAYTQFIASFTTNFRAPRDDETKQNRKFNIQKAADIINGNIIEPGAEWSFNTVVGPRTYDLGWKGANGISNGKEYTIQAGGGICQVSTTLYNALMCGNLEIVDRRAHSIPSDYVEKGLDATVDTSGIDFVFRNNTEHPIYVFAKVEPVEGSSSRNTITVFLYGSPLPDGVTYKARSEVIETTERLDTVYTNDATIPVGYQKELVIRHDGFVAEAYLEKYVDGKLVDSTLMHTDKYRGNPAQIAIGTGPALAPGATPDPTWQLYGTPPTAP